MQARKQIQAEKRSTIQFYFNQRFSISVAFQCDNTAACNCSSVLASQVVLYYAVLAFREF